MDASSRQVLLLATLFALSSMTGMVVVSAASIVGGDLAGDGLSTLPVALALVGGMGAAWFASHFMARFGRQAGFAVGTSVAVLGAALAAYGIVQRDFLAFCVGSLLLGILGGVAPYYRFTAVEVSKGAPGKAIGAVLAGGVAAGLLGPPIGAASRQWLAEEFAGSYLTMALIGAGILLLLILLRAPVPPPVQAKGRALRDIARDPRFPRAILASATAFAAMVLTMVAAPLSLTAAGHGFGQTALVLQGHFVAMFAPSLASGWFVTRFGHGRTMAMGLALLGGAIATNLVGHGVVEHWTALVLLGLGWNLLFVAGSALLTLTHAPEEKARVQGANDFTVAAVGAAAALLAGPTFSLLGWSGLNVAVGALLTVCATGLFILGRPRPGGLPGPA
jgi:MFS family permease